MRANTAEYAWDDAAERLLPLTSREIHLWMAHYEEIGDSHLHGVYRQWMNADERAQEHRFFFPRDRRRYLVTRALVRGVLSRYVSIAPEAWMFTQNAYGRPEIANAEGKDRGLSFNISHTHSMIVLAVSRRRALGVDVENVRDREASIDIARHYFAPSEVKALQALPRRRQHDRFFEYWTFKESYIKARGMGLSLPLDKFSFHYPSSEAVEISIDHSLDDDRERWQFWQFRPTPEYLVALCAERIGDDSPIIVVRQAVPMRTERTLAADFLRTSESVFDNIVH